MKYLVLGEYVKSGKKIWWHSSASYLWEVGKTKFMPGTTTEVKIVDIINLTEVQEMKKAICEVFDNTEDSSIKETLEKFTY